MLDTFLEHGIQKKLELYHILQASKLITMHEICELLRTNAAGVNHLIGELNSDFKALAHIEYSQQIVSIRVSRGVTAFKLLHRIYANSDILKCLRFMLSNDTERSFKDFINTYFFSKSTAYRIKKTCENYLECIGLSVENNRVMGEEYRIRFVIALLYYIYGIDCCGIDADSHRLAKSFILSTNHTIDLDFLEQTENEYGYFECLLILSWKRKQYSAAFSQPPVLIELKKLPCYAALRTHLQDTIEKALDSPFTEADYDYIFMAYCCTNSCVFADRWTESDRAHISACLIEQKPFTDLIARLDRKFHIKIQSSHALRAVMVYFAKKLILGLQCIIPDKHFYLDSRRSPTTLTIIQAINEVLELWRRENQLQYPIDPNHIRCLALQFEAILRQFVPPVPVIIVSDLIVELEIMELTLKSKFSEKQIHITKFLLNTQPLTLLNDAKDSILIVTHRLANYIHHLRSQQDNIVLSISTEINSYDRSSIEDAVAASMKKGFAELLKTL